MYEIRESLPERAQAKVESHTNAKGQRFKLQKVDDAVKGSEVHAVAAIVPVGLPKLLEPPKVVAPKVVPPKVVAPLKEAHLREHVSTLEEPGSKRPRFDEETSEGGQSSSSSLKSARTIAVRDAAGESDAPEAYRSLQGS